MYCKTCGAAKVAGAEFCAGCGSMHEAAEPQTQAAASVKTPFKGLANKSFSRWAFTASVFGLLVYQFWFSIGAVVLAVIAYRAKERLAIPALVVAGGALLWRAYNLIF